MRSSKNVRALLSILSLVGAAPAPGAFNFYRPGVRLHPDGDGNAGGDGGGGGGAGGGAGGGGDGSDGGEKPVVPKDQYDAVLRESIERRDQLKNLKAELQQIKSTMPSVAEVEALRQWKAEKSKEEEARKAEQGKLQEVLQEVRAQAAKVEAELRAKISELEQRLRDERIENKIAMELPKHTSFPVEEISPVLRRSLAVVNETVAPIGKDGEPVLDSETGKPMSVEKFIEQFVSKRPHIAQVKPKGGSGAQPNNNGKPNNGRRWTPEAIDKLSAAEFAKHEKEILEDMEKERRGVAAV